MRDKSKLPKIEEQWLFIRNGQPDSFGLTSIQQYESRMTPLVEIRFFTPSTFIEITKLKPTEIVTKLMDFYNNQIKSQKFFPGRYGDWIKVNRIDFEDQQFISVNFIGQTAWFKATQAADIGMFVKNSQSVYFVCIVRRNEPGKGLPAILGGIMHTDKVLDSAAFTCIKEAAEEGNFHLSYEGNLEELEEDYTIQEFPVGVKGFESLDPTLERIDAIMHFICSIKTPEQERNTDGTKRVYVTTAYALMVDVQDVPLSEEKLREIFQSGDDAAGIVITDVSQNFSAENSPAEWIGPQFGLDHHEYMYHRMIERLRDFYSL